ncbi:hypothetical protein GIB67_030267 [Kingdonia uniflora]|uniref:Pentatricopeptide repeat-containing protein n=1 Tax=Kingdonia uniflora TaxID=39325 RepID=A0A7J7M6H0_9MAGN|nr:hypothetical protein GIB67_030267 [Kingdonia uniflora]
MITSISRHLSTPIRLKFLLITSFPFSNSSKIEDYWTVLQSDNGYESNLERNLTKIRGNLNGSVVEDIMRRCSIGDRDRSILGLRFFIWAGLQSDYRHSTLMYKRATDIFDISGNPKWFVDILEAYRKEGCSVSVKTFKEILYLCRERGAEEALGVLRKMSEFKCMPDTMVFNVVIRLFSEKGDMDVVVGLREEMASLDLYPDMITYAAMIKGFCNVGLLEDAYGLFEIMRQHGCFPNVVAYSAVLDGFCKSGNLDRAMQLLDEMEKEGKDRKPNVVTYTSVIQSFCENGRITEALAVLDRMNSNGCRPNRITMGILINGLCTEGRMDEAYVLVDKLALDGSVSSGLSLVLLLYLCVEMRTWRKRRSSSRRCWRVN